jgi:hypothetical protein
VKPACFNAANALACTFAETALPTPLIATRWSVGTGTVRNFVRGWA